MRSFTYSQAAACHLCANIISRFHLLMVSTIGNMKPLLLLLFFFSFKWFRSLVWPVIANIEYLLFLFKAWSKASVVPDWSSQFCHVYKAFAIRM